jgi:hypothetical protein
MNVTIDGAVIHVASVSDVARVCRVEPASPLPLADGARPCQRTGWCCEQGTCGFGEWDAAAGRCAALHYDDDGLASCEHYDAILSLPVEAWRWSPAFGAGCCSPLNPRRTQGRV